MKIEIISMNGDKTTHEIKAFELRANQVHNWIRLTLLSGNVLTVHRVAVIKMSEVE